MKKFNLEIIVFFSGAVVMVYEMVGSRVLAPFLGTSIIIWTSLIGIILGSLSLGYWLGGKLADKKPSRRYFSMIILIAGLLIALTGFIQIVFLSYLQFLFNNIYLNSIIATIVLFAPASILLGMVSPYAVKLKMSDLNTSGQTVRSLYALSTVGSIVGTFLAGFYLIPELGTNRIIFSLATVMIILSIMIGSKDLFKVKSGMLAAMVGFSILGGFYNLPYVDVDTAYNKVWIFNANDPETGKLIKVMQVNDEASSAMFIDSDDLVFDYTRYFELIHHFKSIINDTLLLGAAGYSYPKYFLGQNKTATMDVVEIDPGLTDLARKHFGLTDNERLHIFHEDARTFLNRNKKKYDIIFIDAFQSYIVPFQLTTTEVVEKIYDSLKPDGIVVINFIASMNSDSSQFILAEHKTYQEYFPYGYFFLTEPERANDEIQNIVYFAFKDGNKPNLNSENNEYQMILQNIWTGSTETDLPILTDDYAPVVKYQKSIISK